MNAHSDLPWWVQVINALPVWQAPAWSTYGGWTWGAFVAAFLLPVGPSVCLDGVCLARLGFRTFEAWAAERGGR